MAVDNSSKVVLLDRSGASMHVNCYQGYYFYRGGFPIPFEDHMRGVRDMKLREDDVLLCSYPKSGTHWLWEIVSMLAHEDLQYRENIRGMDMLDFCSKDLLDSTQSPRVIGCHFPFQFLPKDVTTTKPKIIYLQRHPKSVAVSYYNMTCGMSTVRSYHGKVPVHEYDGTWQDYLDMFLQGKVEYGSWFDHVREWQQAVMDHSDLPIFVLLFEDMKKDPVSCVQRLSQYLGKPCNEERAKAVVDACSSENFKKANTDTQADGVGWKEQSKMFRKGSSTAWKDWFTVAQNERFNAVLKSKLSGFLEPYF